MRCRSRSALVSLSLLSLAACDITVPRGTTLVFGNQGTVSGSFGNSTTLPRPAVSVEQEGTAVIQDANVRGGLAFIERADQGGFTTAGREGIIVSGGTVRVLKGLIRGGAVLSLVEFTNTRQFVGGGAGIRAEVATVEISGGTIMGGDVVSIASDSLFGFPGAGLAAASSTVRITGGTFTAGRAQTNLPTFFPASFAGDDSNVDISGGVFEGVVLSGSRTRLRGGVLGVLTFGSGNAERSCNEIRGGQITALNVFGGRVFVFGRNLVEQPTGPDEFRLTGTLENGTPIDVPVMRTVGFGTLTLVTPGSPGCDPAP